MRKADIRRKPQLHKYGNKITFKLTPEEQQEAQKTLDIAKAQSTTFKVLPKGFSYTNNFKKKTTDNP